MTPGAMTAAAISTSDGTFTYGFDTREPAHFGLLAPATPLGYVFRAQGRRKTKTVNGATTVFVHRRRQISEVLEYDGTSGAILRLGMPTGSVPNDVLNQTNVTVAGTRSTAGSRHPGLHTSPLSGIPGRRR